MGEKQSQCVVGLTLRPWKNKSLFSVCSEVGRSSTLHFRAGYLSVPWVPSYKRCYIKTRYFISFLHSLPVKQGDKMVQKLHQKIFSAPCH